MEMKDRLIERLDLIKEHLNKTLGIKYVIDYIVIAYELREIKIIIHNKSNAGYQAFIISSKYIMSGEYLEISKQIMKIINI